MNLSRIPRLRGAHRAIAAAMSFVTVASFTGCSSSTPPGGSSGGATGTTGSAAGSTGSSAGGTTGAAGSTSGATTGSTGSATGASTTGTSGATGASGVAGTSGGSTGTSGTSGAATGATGASGTGTETDGGCTTFDGKLQNPNPIISRGAPVYWSVANSAPTLNGAGAAVVDGQYHNGGWSAGFQPVDGGAVPPPSWVAIKLAAGPTRVLVSWDDGGTYNYQDVGGTTVYGLPAAYHIDTSANSTNGMDGTWTTQVTVTANMVRTRAHSIPFAGQTWVKMVITAAPTAVGTTGVQISSNGVQIGEIDVHDISATGTCLPEDTWFFMGDSITAFAYDRAALHQPSYAAGINTASPTYFPAMINGGIGGETSANGLARLAEVLTLNPDYRFFALSYGTNDAGNNVGTATFQSNMQSMITMLKAAGRTVVIPHIPYSGDGGHGSIPSYNTVIDTLVASNTLLAGPDLYTFFMNNQADFVCGCSGGRTTDNLHPNDVGLQMMNALWTTAMRSLYP